MRGTFAARAVRFVVVSMALVWVAGPSAAIEFWDDRIQVHGYFESTVRSIWEDFSGSNDWDMSQWWNVLNLEIEADIAPDGFGPFDLVSAFARVEVRYDCVWRRSCAMFENVDMYGDRSGRLAQRVSTGRRSGYSGNQFLGDTRRYQQDSVFQLGLDNKNVPAGSRKTVDFFAIPGFNGFFGIEGPDAELGTSDDPGLYTFNRLDGCEYGVQRLKGSSNRVGSRVLPWNPKCKIRSNFYLNGQPNPFNDQDRNDVVLGGAPGGFALPFRPASEFVNRTQLGRRAPDGKSQGLFVPNHRLAQALKDGDFDSFDQNFTVNELQWNRGASQQDEKELKEAYLDVEMFDSRLWLRLGKQNIVWGKTELFRTTDQFNPQDLGLASLPSLEESRIALWAARAVWSFYSVGPLEDVRAEVAINYDQFEPTDLGRCGEPYSPLPVCGKTFGLQAHGVSGVALAGEIRPANPWNSWKGIEVGGRLEFRYDRFSFAITDFYGYNDGFYVDKLFDYSRNVDPFTGRPRKGEYTGRCKTGREDACLTPGNALEMHSANQTVFAMICASSVGVSDLDRSACAQSVFNSNVPALPGNLFSPTVVGALTNAASGQTGLDPTVGPAPNPLNGTSIVAGLGGYTATTLAALAAFPDVLTAVTLDGLIPTPLVPLTLDPNDGPANTATSDDPIVAFAQTLWSPNGVSRFLTDEQEALLGCGPFYQTQCDIDGLDLLNAEASVLYQSWPLFEGTFGTFWDTTDRGRAQPGTVNFDGGPVATRYVDGELVILPGARGPGDKGYDIRKDGSPGGRVHPFTGQAWDNEMAILSWNFLAAAVPLSTGDDLNAINVFDPDNPFADDKCSYKRPQYCSFVSGLIDLTATSRRSVRAGGNGKFGRRDLTWHSGGDAVLRYEKRNVLGISMDFAEDTTKSNWSFEFTWIEGLPQTNNDENDRLSEADNFNLTVSVDRPTFINFMNQNRTFFFNAQFFFQYVEDYRVGFTSNGPWNFLGTFAVSTGYFQDRLLPSVVFVYDKRSNSGAFLPQVTYRFTENFSATFGMAAFAGRMERKKEALNPLGTSSTRVGRSSSSTWVENGLTAVRERDEAFLRIRYTF